MKDIGKGFNYSSSVSESEYSLSVCWCCRARDAKPSILESLITPAIVPWTGVSSSGISPGSCTRNRMSCTNVSTQICIRLDIKAKVVDAWVGRTNERELECTLLRDVRGLRWWDYNPVYLGLSQKDPPVRLLCL